MTRQSVVVAVVDESRFLSRVSVVAAAAVVVTVGSSPAQNQRQRSHVAAVITRVRVRRAEKASLTHTGQFAYITHSTRCTPVALVGLVGRRVWSLALCRRIGYMDISSAIACKHAERIALTRLLLSHMLIGLGLSRAGSQRL